jgi:hypothetical protein
MEQIIEENRVKFIRLKNGDDIVAEVIEIGENDQVDYMLLNPLKVVYISSTTSDDYLQIAFMPWVFPSICIEQDFYICSDDVLTMGNITEKMIAYYWKNMDYFSKKETKKESVEEPEKPDSEELKDILDKLLTSTRTFH